jgi:hypothetical protein
MDLDVGVDDDGPVRPANEELMMMLFDDDSGR